MQFSAQWLDVRRHSAMTHLGSHPFEARADRVDSPRILTQKASSEEHILNSIERKATISYKTSGPRP